jgi:hypothetical protein
MFGQTTAIVIWVYFVGGRFGHITTRQEGFCRVHALFDGFVIASECETNLAVAPVRCA